MANPAADYPANVHSSTDVSAFGSTALGSTSTTHTDLEGKQEEELAAVQTKIGIGSSTPSDATVLKGTGAGTSAWGQVDVDELNATGTASSSTFLRGDGSWAAPAAGGGGDLLASNNLSDVDNTGTARDNLGLEIGADVQAYSAILDGTTASYTTAQETKLGGIATAATANDTDANLKNRANHTGTQTLSTISDAGTAAALNIHVGTTAPVSPSIGDIWIDTN